MAKTIRFLLEHKETKWAGKNKKGSDSELLELKGHELVTKKFINAFAWEVMASPLRLDTKYEATWGKPMEHDNEKKFTLWNFEPILDSDATADTPKAPKEKISEPAGSFIKPTPPPVEVKPPATSLIQQGQSYEEVKAKLLKAMGEFLDLCYVDYHLGVKK